MIEAFNESFCNNTIIYFHRPSFFSITISAYLSANLILSDFLSKTYFLRAFFDSNQVYP